MTALLLALLLIQAAPGPTGFATGIVRSANGSPAPGVRVYAIPAGDPNAASTGATVFESLAQTDVSGRYRLEIPVGRYYIAVGSVSSPTYYPDTASIASAKVISIVAGSSVEGVDFSRYTAAVSSPSGAIAILPPARLPGSTGVLSGVVRNSDGSVASGVWINAAPISVVNGSVTGTFGSIYYVTIGNQQVPVSQQTGGLVRQAAQIGTSAFTDNQGRYRIENLPPDTYNIVAGFSDSPVFYPGTGDSQKATAITTTPTTLLTTLDIVLPPWPKTYSIRGLVTANNRQPAGGVTLNLQRVAGVLTGAASFLPSRSYNPRTTGGDGTFEIPDVVPGKYSLLARLSIGSPLTKTVDVVDQAVNIDFNFSVNVLSGRIVWEDGSPFSDPAIGPIAVSTFSNPNFVATDLLPVSYNGAFSSVIDSGDYRFYIRSLPAGYIVRTMTLGPVDLAKDPLHLSGDVPGPIDIRIAKGVNPGTRVRGKVLDAVTGSPPAADHLELCCFATGPFERLSSAILPDGSFDFPNVPPGRYTAELRKNAVQSAAGILNPTIEIGDQEKSGIVLASATQASSVTANITFEDGSNNSSSAALAVALIISPGISRGTSPPNGAKAADLISISMGRLKDGTFWIPFPTGVLYTVAVSNIPEGYRIKSISGPGPTSSVSKSASDGSSAYSGFAPGSVSIVLERTPPN